MVDILMIYPGVNTNHIGIIGICGGGGYTTKVAKTEKKSKMVANLCK
ncbi:MAG: hypothetical protein IJ736_14265 [Firmicutes bacterium]|nr:hypothetical protein [Bacillota bacterium]